MTSTSLATKRAVAYLRVSDAKQAGERHSSLETQEAKFQEYCQRHNLLPVATFVDVFSGRRDDRKEYQRLVDYVMQGGADVVVVQYLDRFGRNPKEILQRYWQLDERGVTVVPTDEDIREELLLLIKAGVAGAESRRNSERVRANMSRVVGKGLHAARPPYGLKPVRDGQAVRWELDSTESPVVREMYRLAVEENLGFKSIGDRLTAQGYRAHGGRPFAAYTVQRILTNEALMGTLTYGKRPRKGNPQPELVSVEGFFPAILSGEEWQRLQERLAIRREASRGHTHASPYLLSGIARCGHCGGPMAGKVGAAYKGKRYRNYWCAQALRSRAQCALYNGHSAPKLEKAILEYLGQFSDPDLVRKHIESAERSRFQQREAELRSVQKGIADLEAQFLKHLDILQRELINEEEFVKANEAIRSQRSALEARKDELTRWVEEERTKTSLAKRVPVEVRSFLEDFQQVDIRLQKARLQTILKAAHVWKGGRIELEFRS